MDNRPLKWEEFLERIGQTVYLSATPGPYELGRVKGDVLMTYDDTSEIRALARRNGFRVRQISMRTSHHKRKRELMISRGFAWL